MSPQLHSATRSDKPSPVVAKSWQHSPPRSPRRPTMGILKNRAPPSSNLLSPKKSSKQEAHSILNEVRESLTMPTCSSGYDEDSEVCDDDTEDGAYLSTKSGSRIRASSHNVDAIVMKNQGHGRATTTKASRPIHQEQAPEFPAKSNWKSNDDDDRSIGAASIKSTKSTRSIRSFFRKRNPSHPTAQKAAGDDVSVAASTKSGWWKRSSMTSEVAKQQQRSSSSKSTSKGPAGLEAAPDMKKDNRNVARSGMQSFQSFRIKKPERVNVRGVVKNNDQLVADFFDVQSFASEPDFVGSTRLRKTVVNEQPQQGRGGVTKKNRVLETSSVVSNRSQRSNVFSKFFQRMRAINDEVLDIDDDDDDSFTPDLTGTGILLHGDESSSLVDDELTLCSGFDSLSHMSSVQDEDDDDDDDELSRRSNDSNQSNASNGNDNDARLSSREKRESIPETPFFHKIMQRRRLKNESTILRDVVGRGSMKNNGLESESDGKIQSYSDTGSPITDKIKLSQHGGSTITPQEQQRLISPMNRNKRLSPYINMESPTQRSKALAQSGLKLLSSKSLSHLPSCIEPLSDDTSSARVTRGLCRWNSDLSLKSDPSAPKRPTRSDGGGGGVGREEGHDETPMCMTGLLSTSSSSARHSPKKNLEKLIKTSQSMRNLSSPHESKSGSDDDDDDDSILSLLSGLLATWSAERDGINVTITQRLPAVCDTGARVKSILKAPMNESEEQKVDSREKYSVRFKTIEVREYERIVGDNPSCSKGPPISIGWGYIVHRHYSINDYEHLVRGPRRTKKEFHLAADRRTHLLVNEWKCSEEDIRKARREATYIQYCRAKTAFSGSRAAAKEAAFLRKANDRSKVPILPKPNQPITSNPNDTSLPKIPLRRRTIEVQSPTSINQSTPSPPVKVLSPSMRQKLLEV